MTSLETMRAMYRMACRDMGLFVNLEVVEKGLLNSRLIEYPFAARKLEGSGLLVRGQRWRVA